MTRIVVSVEIPASPQEVWRHLGDLASHPKWMVDAERIEFVGSQTAGVGTRMHVHTRAGPFRTVDVMEVTAWDEPHTIAVRHEGPVGGSGRFQLVCTAHGTRLTWTEDLRFPWYLGGPLTGVVARSVLRHLWHRSLRRLAAYVVES